MFSTRTAIQTQITPDDQGIEQELADFLALCQSGKGIVFSVYGATLPQFYDGLIAAHNRGCWTKGLFDHTQSAGPAEVVQLHRLALAMPVTGFLIGTSSMAHQILHLKMICINIPNAANDAGVWPEGADFDDWRTAAAAGYPVVWSGSWNLSASASKQANNVDIMPGILRAQAFLTAVNRQYDWIAANEAAYQGVLQWTGKQ